MMTRYQLFLLILAIELLLLLILLFVIIARRCIAFYTKKSDEAAAKAYSTQLIQLLEGKQQFFDPQGAIHPTILLSTIADVNHVTKGDHWEQIKKEIMNTHLLPLARTYANSYLWNRRSFASQCFALVAQPEDRDHIFSLVQDPFFLVSSYAALAAIHLNEAEAIFYLIQHMSQTSGYERYLLRDILSQGSPQVIKWVEALFFTYPDPPMHLPCLEVLSATSNTLSLRDLDKDLCSQNPTIRLAGLKTYGRTNDPSQKEVFVRFLADSDTHVRKEAASKLRFLIDEETITALQNALLDTEWEVRVEAARSLRHMGKEVLERADLASNAVAKEAIQYVMQFA